MTEGESWRLENSYNIRPSLVYAAIQSKLVLFETNEEASWLTILNVKLAAVKMPLSAQTVASQSTALG
jgi:hypothetical protein